MSMQKRRFYGKRWPQALLGLTAVLSAVSACASIVGIEDTTVTRSDGCDGSDGGDENSGGAASSAGALDAGAMNAG